MSEIREIHDDLPTDPDHFLEDEAGVLQHLKGLVEDYVVITLAWIIFQTLVEVTLKYRKPFADTGQYHIFLLIHPPAPTAPLLFQYQKELAVPASEVEHGGAGGYQPANFLIAESRGIFVTAHRRPSIADFRKLETMIS
jgi:hypothetical protein